MRERAVLLKLKQRRVYLTEGQVRAIAQHLTPWTPRWKRKIKDFTWKHFHRRRLVEEYLRWEQIFDSI